MSFSIAAVKLSDVLRPQARGKLLNSHVIVAAREPEPDYDAMNRLVSQPESMSASGDDASKSSRSDPTKP